MTHAVSTHPRTSAHARVAADRSRGPLMYADDHVVPTVTGSVLRPGTGLRLDAHGHAWVAPPSLVAEAAVALTDEPLLASGLTRFSRAAAPRRAALLDVQPPGCGRDAAALARLAAKGGVAIATVTGFHHAHVYPKGLRPWTTADAAVGTFVRELEGGLREVPMARAAAIAAAFSGAIEEHDPCWEGAIEACLHTGALLVVHTDGGAGVEALVAWLDARGVPPDRLYLLDADRRDDRELHLELARAGVLLGFASSLADDAQQGEPYRLLEALLEGGAVDAVAIGLDLEAPARWASRGPVALVTDVDARLRALGASERDVDALLGGALVERAARPEVPFGLGR